MERGLIGKCLTRSQSRDLNPSDYQRTVMSLDCDESGVWFIEWPFIR
jgi:hypothetical protein